NTVKRDAYNVIVRNALFSLFFQLFNRRQSLTSTGRPLYSPHTKTTALMLKVKCFVVFWCAALVFAPHSRAEADLSMGFLYDLFPLTLSSGYRAEAAGPFFYKEKKDTQRTWAVPPFCAHVQDSDLESEEFDIVYPLLSYDRYGAEYRF